MNETHLRIGDAERDQTVQALAQHYAAGRLTEDEFDHRSSVVLRAQSQLDLGEVLADLPALPKPVPVGAADAVRRKARKLWLSAGLAPWAIFIPVFLLIWLFTGGYFWPVWPILGWGIAVATGGVMAYTNPEVYLERQARRGRA